MSDNKNIGKEIAELLKKLIPDLQEQQRQERKNLKEKPVKKSSGGLVDKPFYYNDNYKISPGISETVKKIRKGFSDGGLTDDVSQMEYLVSILESANSLSPMEQKILEDLKSDLQKMGMGGSK